ncbi:unnamed protein product [Ranitomeya imitator]|uniref:Exocyst complex subunit EXOC6/Sec15 C-terminal domain-containing protein n=1 Tax=Ranitomeya imitator TaxID=111125 RepID=A0ABN9LTJ1_9NEOB|nr:unnamed protein product [Ranitomeya imitator]
MRNSGGWKCTHEDEEQWGWKVYTEDEEQEGWKVYTEDEEQWTWKVYTEDEEQWRWKAYTEDEEQWTWKSSREVFENYYRKQRRKQARLVLQPPSNMHETLAGYRKYFHQIVGFFVVEDHILHTTGGLVNRAYVDELWDLALSKTMAALRTHSSYCSDPNLVLDLKNLIVHFADTLQGYGFPVNQLFDMLLEVRDQYGEILLKKWAAVFRSILDADNYSPIPVNDESAYKKIISQFPFQDPDNSFPKKFPFSEFVPKIYCQIKEFIYACLKFSEDLHLRSGRHDSKVHHLLLTRTLSNCLQNIIKRRNVGLTETLDPRCSLRDSTGQPLLVTYLLENMATGQSGIHHVRLTSPPTIRPLLPPYTGGDSGRKSPHLSGSSLQVFTAPGCSVALCWFR